MIPMTIFYANCLYVLKCLALVFVAAPCVLFAGGWACRGAGAAATGPLCSARCMAATHPATFAAAEKNEVTNGTKL